MATSKGEVADVHCRRIALRSDGAPVPQDVSSGSGSCASVQIQGGVGLKSRGLVQVGQGRDGEGQNSYGGPPA